MTGAEYLRDHGIDLIVAEGSGVEVSQNRLLYRYERDDGSAFYRSRYLAGQHAGKTLQPRDEPLRLFWHSGRGRAVLLCEGEPDALSAATAILTADREANQMPIPIDGLVLAAVPGVSMPADRAAEELRDAGAEVVYVAFDGDKPGREGAARIAASLSAIGISAPIVQLPDGKDLSDVLVAADDRVDVLANLVAEAQAAEEEIPREEPPKEEEAPEPLAPETITGLLDDVLAFVDRYVVLPGDHERFAQALWVAHTYAFDGAHATPYMLVLSAEKRSGKTRDLEALGLLVSTPWPVIGASEAAIFRKIDRDRPTMLLDEVDALWGSNTERTEPLRAVLNAGNRPGAAVARCTGEGGTNVEDFSVYCPKALFGIDNGRIPDTQRDRSIVIRMVRKTSAEPVERFRHRIADKEAQTLRKELAGWAAGAAVDLLLQAEPDLPLDLDDRAAEAWEPLLAIADMAGGDWPAKARAAALALSGDVDRDEVTTGTLLLGAIRDAFGESDRITTVELLAKINADEELPFGGWSDGNGLDGRRLAKLLKPYKVKPKTIKLADGSTAKGYLRESLSEVWSRWLPQDPAGSVTTVTAVTGPASVTQEPLGEAEVTPVTQVTPTPEGVTDVADGDLLAEAERVAERFGMEA